ncbi:MAG: hypothetical protein QM645_13950 [Asticcacaulis sp.]
MIVWRAVLKMVDIMKLKLKLVGNYSKHLIIEPWGEEFIIEHKNVEVIFKSTGIKFDCEIGMDFFEEDFLRIDTPSGIQPKVFIDGMEDERPAFDF